MAILNLELAIIKQYRDSEGQVFAIFSNWQFASKYWDSEGLVLILKQVLAGTLKGKSKLNPDPQLPNFAETPDNWFHFSRGETIKPVPHYILPAFIAHDCTFQNNCNEGKPTCSPAVLAGFPQEGRGLL